MSKEDTSKIIQDFLDLWQKQFANIAKDPESVTYLLKFFSNSQNSSYAKPDSATNIPLDPDDELCQLRQRVKHLEARVSDLESGFTETSRRPAKKNPQC